MMLCFATLGAAAFTPGAKKSVPQTRAAVNMKGPKQTPLHAPADAQRSMWFEVEEPPVNEPNISCYMADVDGTNRWMCAYDSDLKRVVDPEDSW